MSYKQTGRGERGLLTELGQFNLPGGWPGFPGGLPGPIAPHPGAPGPTTPGGIFPTHTRVGDVVNVTGPFGGFGQGQVRVKFQGTSWLYPQMMGPTMASVVVPEGAETGLCEIEMNGRRIFGTNCIIDKGVERVGRPSHKGRDTRAWTERGELFAVQGVSTVDAIDIANFGAMALMAFGWFTNKPKLRNIGIAGTIGLFLARRMAR
ncbi:MAG: hypothetical protein ACYSWU_00095 [Planctomycetota bacterium]|jgi:hypothetical protein